MNSVASMKLVRGLLNCWEVVMKQIIDGKLYDTEKADYVVSVETSDHIDMNIFKTRNGVYFGVSPSKEILNERMLKTYLGRKIPDLYIQLFGEVDEA
mgnify:CR=1 FL=1